MTNMTSLCGATNGMGAAMPKRLPPLYPLTDDQRVASQPRELAWLSASAGTGKTQVLTARVMRLLLADVDPAAILCLTFTKAGAAEMADRIHARLAYWVRLKDAALATELKALGEDYSPDAVAGARTLFAKVLDATGGGLRIQTIHAFAQSLLAAFPTEAGIVPGFRPLEDREEAVLARETLSAMLVAAEERGDRALIGDVQTLSRRLGERAAESFLLRCARAHVEMAALGPPELIGDRLRRGLGVPLGDVEKAIADRCSDGVFDCAALRRVAAANAAWGTAATGVPNAELAARWLAAAPAQRVSLLAPLREIWCTKKGDLRKFSAKLIAADRDYAGLAGGLDEAVRGLLEIEIKAVFADFSAAVLRAGQQFARDYQAAKRRIGALDFDDLIRLTGELLDQPGMGDWVRYKLDQSIDHILVDEAQDTNAVQWLIVEKLAEEFFETDPESGSAARVRTIFAVGDFKQAIFGFQGTNPREFSAAQARFSAHIAERKRELRDLSLDKSYRSAPPILELVDAVMEDVGGEAIGLDRAVRPHESARTNLPGRVTLLRPVSGEAPDEEAEEGWLGDATLAMARKLARQVRTWIDDEHWLAAKDRALRPEDVLVLVRSRGELASLIVARLHEEGVPVAGVDRLMLTDPLAIQDLLAALRFALQPDDDLNLASLLVSPLFGWTQERLYGLAKRGNASLWKSLRNRNENEAETLLGINEILAQADLVTPYQLLESILSGPLQGRRKLLARLGEEARDPIEELLNAALQFESEAAPSLQRFLRWFDQGHVEIKRDPSAPLDAVRVMTVHGAKGLQSPLVILADAAFNPDYKGGGALAYPVEASGPVVPVPRPRKEELLGPLAAAAETQSREDSEEHWRLLYVALTRAEEHLVIGGALGARAKGEAPEKSWYATVERAMTRLGGDWIDDALWSETWHFEGSDPAAPRQRAAPRLRTTQPRLAEPDWLYAQAREEERPPRPLAPSSLGPDTLADPPPGEALRQATDRGRLLHRLFERLPDLPSEDRRPAALRWLEHAAGIGDAAMREQLAGDALSIIETPVFADIFSATALAEAPIAAVVDDVVISGTVDRLLVADGYVRVIDFKTGRRVPSSPEDIPLAHLRQMAAYTAALAVIFPDHTIEAALLYSSGPKLILLPQPLLAAHKPRLADSQQSLSPIG